MKEPSNLRSTAPPIVWAPEGLGFVHLNEEHGIKNVGAGPATYYVVAIGPGADTQ